MALPAPDIVQPSGPIMGGPESPVFAPHTGDHGGSLFSHPSTNRGGSPGMFNGGPVRAPEHGVPSSGKSARGLAPRRRLDVIKPPSIGPTGAPRRAGGPSY